MSWERSRNFALSRDKKLHKDYVEFNPLFLGTRPCEQRNWDTWMVLDPWDQM